MKKLNVFMLIICLIFLIFLINELQAATIEAEDYRTGGEGVAYHDSDTTNSGNTELRPDEGVDLWDVGDNVIKIGSVRTGEWVTWEYDFPESGTYTFNLYLSTPNDAATFDFTVALDSKTSQQAENTGDYKSFVPYPIEMHVDKGTQIIRIDFTGDSLDLDRIDFELTKADSTNTTTATVVNNGFYKVNESPFPDYYNGNIGWRIDSNIVDGQKISLNNLHIVEPTRIGVIPGCKSTTACVDITSVQFFVDNVEMNTESTYTYDLKYPASAASAESADEFPEGFHTIKAIVTKTDGTTLEMNAQFMYGNPTFLQFDNLTTYVCTSDKKLGLSWDQSVGASAYQVRIYNVERDTFTAIAKIPQPDDETVNPSITVSLPGSGHSIPRVRAIVELTDEDKESIDAADSIEALKTICEGWFEFDTWWNENLTLDELKQQAKQSIKIASEWTITSTPSGGATVRLKTGEITTDKGWWVYSYPNSPTGGSISFD